MQRVIIYILVLFLAGCQEDEKKTCTIKQVQSSYGSSGAETTFEVFYTGAKVSAVRATHHALNNQQATWFLEWEGENISYFFYEEEGAGYKDHYYYTYGNNISNVRYYKVSAGDTLSEDESQEFYLSRPAADGMYYFQGEFFEVKNENVIRSGFYDVVNGENVINPAGQALYTYDEHENLLGQLSRLPNFLYLGYVPIRMNSKNNLTEASFTTDGYKKNYTFNYDKAGNLLTFIDQNTGHQLAFSHECK